MAEILLKNIANFSGEYLGEPVTFSSNEVETTILSGLTAVKSADKSIWINGPLTYTVVVNNDIGENLTDVVFLDYFDPLLINFNTSYGVYINGTMSTYTYYSNTLTVPIPQIEQGGQVSITFQVVQA